VSKGLHVIVNGVVDEALERKSTKSIFINGYQRNAFLHYSAMRNKFGKTPLFEAVKNGHMDVARALVKHEIVTAYDGLNTMRIAIKRGNEDMVRYLIGESKLASVNMATLGTYALTATTARESDLGVLTSTVMKTRRCRLYTGLPATPRLRCWTYW
jgi:hypothetical protein